MHYYFTRFIGWHVFQTASQRAAQAREFTFYDYAWVSNMPGDGIHLPK